MRISRRPSAWRASAQALERASLPELGQVWIADLSIPRTPHLSNWYSRCRTRRAPVCGETVSQRIERGAMSAYRADIDGLRAICIVSVVMFHAGFSDWSGGFVGVDIFFVISGYLITSLIVRQVRQGQFTQLGFYERRVRRLLAATVPVLIFTTL